MKRKFAAGDGASLGNPAKFILTGIAGDMFQNSYGSPRIGKPMSASTPVAETGSRRQTHVTSNTAGIGVFRTHHSPSPSAMDAAEVELRRVIDNFVNVYEQLDRSDSTSAKPNYSYTELAFLAMLRAPNFCLPITEIYRYECICLKSLLCNLQEASMEVNIKLEKFANKEYNDLHT